MKYCTKCEIAKPISEFNKVPNTDRYRSECKDCKSLINKEYARKPENVIRTSWHHNNYHSELRGHEAPSYSYKELKDWAFSQAKFFSLYEAWISSGYNRRMKPSIDRIDDDKSYSLDNIQLVTFGENEDKYRQQVRDGRENTGLLNGGHCLVVQKDLYGNIIAEFVSQSQASRLTGVRQGCISACCLGIQKTAGGFIWQKK